MFYHLKTDCDVSITVHVVHQGSLDKQLYRVERKYSMAERKLQEQKEKERQNKVKFRKYLTLFKLFKLI